MSEHPQITRDREMQLRHLKQAEQHLALGKRHIAEQEDRIAELARRGYDTAIAQELLDSFYALQVQHIQHHDRILKALERYMK